MECPFHVLLASISSLHNMSLASCSRFFRPSCSRIGPALGSSRWSGCRFLTSLENRLAICSTRLAVRHASGNVKQGTNALKSYGLFAAGITMLGGTLFYVSYNVQWHFLNFVSRGCGVWYLQAQVFNVYVTDCTWKFLRRHLGLRDLPKN